MAPEAGTREALRRRYLKVDSATVADVLDRLGLPNQGLAPQFAPYPANTGPMGGWAYTLRGKMTRYSASGDPRKMKAVDGLGRSELAAWSGKGRGVCFFGELIALGMKRRGCAGALVDGGIRDIEWIAKQRFPVYARYRTPVQSIGRWKVTAWQVPVTLPGATSKRVKVTPAISCSRTRTASSSSRQDSPQKCSPRPSASRKRKRASAASSIEARASRTFCASMGTSEAL